MPKATVAHDGKHPPLHHGRHARAAGQAHAVAQNGVAHRKRLKRGQRVAANVAGYMHLAHLLLSQLERRKHRPLGAAYAHTRRAGWQGARRSARRHLHAPNGLTHRQSTLLVGVKPALRWGGVHIGGVPGQKAQQPLCQDLYAVFAAAG